MAVVKKVRPNAPEKKKKRVVASADSGPFTLATEKSDPSESLLDYTILMFGGKKLGKTSLAAMFPDAYFAATEPGQKSLAVFKSDIPNWLAFKDFVKVWRKDKRFKMAVVDTIDILFKHCDDFVCRKLGVTHVSEADWGKGWAELRKEFEAEITKLISAPGKGTMFISHDTEKEIQRRDGSKYDRVQPTMQNIARDIIESTVDIWAHMDYQDDRRVLTIRGNENLTAGHRLQDRFRWDGREVVTIDMGLTKEEAYANFMAAFNNQYPIPDEPEPAPPVVVKKKTMKLKKKTAA